MDKDIALAFIVGIVAVCVTTVLPICMVYMKREGRMKTQQQLPASDIVARLERMELGIESISAEIERIGEGQRFTTKLLNVRNENADQLPRSGT